MTAIKHLALTAMLLAPPAAALHAATAARPNIIFLMDDQHRWDALGVMDPAIKTPALDRLAKTGILFDQAACQAPMCTPSRYSIMLGLYPHQIGILSNGPGLKDAQLPSAPLAEVLRQAGYQTAGFGKTHWSTKDCSTRGFEVRYSATDDEQGAITMRQDNPAGLKRYDAETKDYGPGEEDPAGYIGRTSEVPEADHRDGWTTKRCLEFLDKGLDAKRPLFLYLSFLKPHAGHNVPTGFESFYDLSAMPVPKQPLMEQIEPNHATGTNREKMYREFWSKATDTQWREMILRYRANCSWTDSMFGRVIDKLRAQGLLDNCLIIYTSDHGEMLGERYYRFNKYCLYESSVRVPLIVSGTAVPPAQQGTTDHRPAELVDVVPTILQQARVGGQRAKPGEDLLAPGSRQASFCEYNDQTGNVSFMWRTPTRKLILTFPKAGLKKGPLQSADSTAGEFYDLQADAKEWNNLYQNAGCRVERDRMTTELLAHLNNVVLKK